VNFCCSCTDCCDYVFDEGHITDDVMQDFDEQQKVLHEDNLQMDEGIINLHFGFYEFTVA
jgi:hypothetical protein